MNCDRNQLNRVVFSENTTPTTVYCFDNKLKDLVLPNVSRLRQLDCRNNLLSSVGPLSDAMNWNSFFTEGNPGAEGVFTVFIYDNVRYYSNIPTDWIWEGNEVSVRIVRVPAE